MVKAILVLLLLAAGDACFADEHAALTSSDDGVRFRNEMFALRVTKPDSWYSQNVEEQLLLQQRGKKILSGDDNNLKAVLQAALDNVVPIFSFFAKPPGTPGVLNPSVVALAENIKLYPGMKSGCDYLRAVQHTASMGQMHYEFDEECRARNFGTVTLNYVDAHMTIGKVRANQRYFATIRNGYAVSLIQTWFDADGERSTDQVVATLKLGD